MQYLDGNGAIDASDHVWPITNRRTENHHARMIHLPCRKVTELRQHISGDQPRDLPITSIQVISRPFDTIKHCHRGHRPVR